MNTRIAWGYLDMKPLPSDWHPVVSSAGVFWRSTGRTKAYYLPREIVITAWLIARGYCLAAEVLERVRKKTEAVPLLRRGP